MVYTPNGFRLTPSYDQVAAVLYQYKTMALKMGGKENMQIGNLMPNNIIKLGQEFNLSFDAINMAINNLAKQLNNAKEIIEKNSLHNKRIAQKIIELMEKRWNRTFALIGKKLSVRR